VSTLLPIDLTNNSHVDIARKGDTSVTCNNPRQHEIIVNSTSAPWILSFVCDPTWGVISDPTGVESLSSLQSSVTFGMYCYSLATVLFGDNCHFCSILVDPNPGGDLNIFYDAMKQRQRHSWQWLWYNSALVCQAGAVIKQSLEFRQEQLVMEVRWSPKSMGRWWRFRIYITCCYGWQQLSVPSFTNYPMTFE